MPEECIKTGREAQLPTRLTRKEKSSPYMVVNCGVFGRKFKAIFSILSVSEGVLIPISCRLSFSMITMCRHMACVWKCKPVRNALARVFRGGDQGGFKKVGKHRAAVVDTVVINVHLVKRRSRGWLLRFGIGTTTSKLLANLGNSLLGETGRSALGR